MTRTTHSPAYPAARLDAPPLAARLLRRAAWAVDRSVEVDDAWIAAFERAVRDGRHPPLRVLGLGAGHQALLGAFAARGHDCIAVHGDAETVTAARRRGTRALRGSAEELPQELASRGGAPNTFDVVLLVHALEHARDQALALGNAARLLRPGGALVVQAQNAACVGAPAGAAAFTAQSLRAAVERAGLAVARVEHAGYARQFSPPGALVDHLVRFARTAWSRDELRYDTVRVIARKPQRAPRRPQ